MREILFRGKRIGNGKWVYGFYHTYPSREYDDEDENYEDENENKYVEHRIIENGYGFLVDPETVGQFTGVCDKNGVRIFENDVIKIEIDDIAIVRWNDYCAMFDLRTEKDNVWNFTSVWCCEMEVIGNIYDNPEIWNRRAET